MTSQNYSAEDAFRRWRKGGLRRHIESIRGNYISGRSISLIASHNLDLYSDTLGSTLGEWHTLMFGRVTWGVFARAFWPIYQPGKRQLFYGSVIFSDDPDDEDSPTLFEISEFSREVMECDGLSTALKGTQP